MATRTQIKNSYDSYRSQFKRAQKKGYKFREGIELMTFAEYIASYNEVDPAIQALRAEGYNISHSQFLMNESYEKRYEEANAFVQLLIENGVEVSYDEFQRDPAYYTKLLRSYYPDDDSYDMAVSTTFNVSLG